MSKLSAPLRDLLEEPNDSGQVDRVHRRLRISRGRLKRRQMRPSLVAVSLICGAIVGASIAVLIRGYAGGGAPIGPARLQGGGELSTLSVSPETEGEIDFELADGSTLRLDPGTQLDTEENTGSVLVLVLRAGRAVFDVVPGRYELFRVRAGEVEVDVVGTSFSVERQSDRIIVEVLEGVVDVGGELYDRRRLSRGQRVALDLEPPSSQRASNEPVPPVEHSAMELQQPPAPEIDGGRSWRDLARQRAFEEAYELLGSQGVQRETRRAASPDELFTIADVARLSGHPREAIPPLEQIMESFPQNHRAALAAFTLGRIYLDALGEPERAVEAFEQALQLGPPTHLCEDAQARVVESLLRSGNNVRAMEAARAYFERYPDGRHEARLRRLTGLGSN